MSVSLLKCLLVSRITQALGIFSVLITPPTPLNFCSSWASLPPASHSYESAFNFCHEFSWPPLFCLSLSLCSLFSLLLLLPSSPMALFGLLLSPPALDSSRCPVCTLPHVYNKSLPLNHTLEGHVLPLYRPHVAMSNYRVEWPCDPAKRTKMVK